MAQSDLTAIRTKFRRLTRLPSVNLISDQDIDEYVNTFVEFDFPEHLRLFQLRDTFTFYTQPYQDTYSTLATVGSEFGENPLGSNVINTNFLTIHPPVFMAGRPGTLSQSRSEFFAVYPIVQFQSRIGSGDGFSNVFTGTLSSVPVLQNQVIFNSIATTGEGLIAIDDGAGNLLTQPFDNPAGSINYVTGAFTVVFLTPPGVGVPVYAQTVPYVPNIPESMLFFDNTITLRPVPAQVYSVSFEVYKKPTQLITDGSQPLLNEWWQYIAYGAAKKLFEDRSDQESVQGIMEEFKKQETLCLRRTLVQQANERTATIYAQQTNGMPVPNGWWGSGTW